MAKVAWLTFRKIKEQGDKCRAQSRLGGWGLADCMCCVSGQAEHLRGVKLRFGDVAPGLELYFKSSMFFYFSNMKQ